jgi:hypothetical protein
MEFELTIRGNTGDLASLLELLGKSTDSSNGSMTLDNDESEFPTATLWKYDLQESFWNGLSEKAQEFMIHLCMECDNGNLYGEFICDPSGLEQLVEDACGMDEPCKNPWEHRMWGKRSDGIAVEPGCGIDSHSMGGRLASIRRNMAAPPYASQTIPVERIRHFLNGEPRLTRYRLTTNWPEFIFQKWWVKNGGKEDNLPKIAEDQVLE